MYRVLCEHGDVEKLQVYLYHDHVGSNIWHNGGLIFAEY